MWGGKVFFSKIPKPTGTAKSFLLELLGVQPYGIIPSRVQPRTGTTASDAGGKEI